MKFTHLALAAGLVCMTTPVLATDAYDACARAAASQYELGYANIGRNSTDIDIAAATTACQAALEEAPDSLQLKAWLGRVYETAEDYPNALPLLEEAANGGVPLAQAIYGDLLIVGEHVSADWTRGNDYLDQAAALGFAPAMDSLALSYDYGEGVEQNHATALAFYRRAALAGLPRAATNTGLMYLEGLGTDRDPVAAEAWLLRAARSGDARAAYNLGKLYEGTDLAELPDYAAAVTWYQQASDAAYPLASLALGYLMQHGYGTQPDPGYAARLYQYAADSGIAQAQLNLAMLYEDGNGVPQDFAQARLLYRQAADNGLSDAAANLGLLYLGHSGDYPDYDKAMLYTRRAADAGNAIALNNLGFLYENGLGATGDLKQARENYERSASLGYQPAADNLARLDAALEALPPAPAPKVYPRSKIDN